MLEKKAWVSEDCFFLGVGVGVCVPVCACVRACVRACACVLACVRACVCVCVCVTQCICSIFALFYFSCTLRPSLPIIFFVKRPGIKDLRFSK